MKTQLVYLAGPITGLDYDEAMRWRLHSYEFLTNLRDSSGMKKMYEVLDPLRGKGFLKGTGAISPVGLPHIAQDQWVFKRDRWDVSRCDVALFNLTDAEKTGFVSTGTCFEMAWAEEMNKFSLIVMRPENPHWHAFVRQAASLIVPTLEDAHEYLKKVLNSTVPEDVSFQL